LLAFLRGRRADTMDDECGKCADARTRAHGRRLDLIAFGVIVLVVTIFWIPTLASGRRLSVNDDFLLHCSRHDAVRKSLLEHRQFPLRSHWFGGGFPTLGEPEDPALNPLVLLSVLLGSAMGLKLMGFTAALASGAATYALARYILTYTRWGSLFVGLIVGTSLYVPTSMPGGNIGELCAAYLPLCLLMIGLACRGRWTAIFLLPLVLCTMLSQGKQTFVMVVLYMGLVCLLDASRTFNTLTPAEPRRKVDVRALTVLLVALGATLFVGMVRILPALEFIGTRGGLTDLELFPLATRVIGGPGSQELLRFALGIGGRAEFVTIGWVPVILFGIASCCFWRTALPWVICFVLSTWIALGDHAPVDLFALLKRLPVFGTIAVPGKYFFFQIIFSIVIAAGQFFWLLEKARRKWVEPACALALIVGGVGLLYPMSTRLQRNSYTMEMPPEPSDQQVDFFSIQGRGLERNRLWPPAAMTYPNLLQNVGTIDWHVAVTMPENAIPRYFVDSSGTPVLNPRYRGEAFLVTEAGDSAASLPGQGPDSPGYVTDCDFHPNSIAVGLTVRRPGILVINQNYHPAWRSDRGELFERDGLIALRLSETGSHMIRLRYLPRSFVVGLIVSVLSIVGWALACWAVGARPRQCLP
jgi:hypothetical protein